MNEPELIAAEVERVAETLPAVRANEAIVARGEISVEEVVAQREKIVEVMRAVMQEGVHYGRIPGIDKPTLFKPGAEVINVALRLAPHYESEKIWHDDGHLTVSVLCTLKHIPTGLEISTGEGLCTTRESKYAYRQGGRTCPECGKPAIIKGKAEYGGGWLCFGKKGGCGTKWADGTPQAREFEDAATGRMPNEDLPDTYNTVLKMADKRALVAAVLNGTAASDVFTQDAEDVGGATPEGVISEIFGEADLVREFDPSKNFLDGAPRGQGAKEDIVSMMNNLDPSLDWPAVIEEATEAVFGERLWRDLPSDKQKEFWTRLSNSLTWVMNEVGSGDFPPASEEKIIAGFAFGFNGHEVSLHWSGEEELQTK